MGWPIRKTLPGITHNICDNGNGSKHKKTVHVNMLKHWTTPDASDIEKMGENFEPRVRESKYSSTYDKYLFLFTNYSPTYQIAPVWKKPLRDELKSIAKAGIIHPTLTPWSSPVLLVKKKMEQSEFVNFRELNTATILNPYEMPCIDDKIDRLGEAKLL